MRRYICVPSLVAALTALMFTAPVSAATDWHTVREPWQSYEVDELYLPADRYCGDFDLSATPVFQDVRQRVISRWNSGGPRETVYNGPLRTRNTNKTTGESVLSNLSGRAETIQREDGSLATYASTGPIGMGFPRGSVGLDAGFYLFRGRHVVDFPAGHPRRLVVDRGTETNICDLVR
ncbi:MAG: hypothetical protein WBQ48_10405 [Aeromicrobium sp.]